MEIFTNVILLIIGAILTFLGVWFWRIQDNNRAEKKELQNRLEKIDLQLITLTTQVSPFWAAVQTKIAKDLTHPNPQFKEMDNLLLKLENLTITIEERSRLLDLIKERIVSTDPKVSQSEKDSAKIMETVMEKVVANHI